MSEAYRIMMGGRLLLHLSQFSPSHAGQGSRQCPVGLGSNMGSSVIPGNTTVMTGYLRESVRSFNKSHDISNC